MEDSNEDSREDIMGEEIYQKALEYAKKKHEGQFRIGGAPFIVHPIAVAEILRMVSRLNIGLRQYFMIF